MTSNFSFLRGASHAENSSRRPRCWGLPRSPSPTAIRSPVLFVRMSRRRKRGFVSSSASRLDLEDAPSLLCYPDGPQSLWPPVPSPLARSGTREERAMHFHLADVAAHAEGRSSSLSPLKIGTGGRRYTRRDRHSVQAQTSCHFVQAGLSTPPLRAAAPAGMTRERIGSPEAMLGGDLAAIKSCHPGRAPLREPAHGLEAMIKEHTYFLYSPRAGDMARCTSE